MARTQKDVVSYFPHDANASSSDTLTVLQGRYGNDGYAFWFKLLEKLASTEGHYIDCRNQVKMQVFMAKMGVEELRGVEILNLLVEMQAIDKELWESKVIWCENLVKNLDIVYKNRRRDIPQKPIITGNNRITTGSNPITTSKLPVESTQSRVDESKVDKSRKEEREEGGMGGDSTPSPVGSSVLKIFLIKFPYAFGREPDSREMAQLRDFAAEVAAAGGATDKQIHDAFAEAAGHNKCNVSYVRAVLLDWLGVPR